MSSDSAAAAAAGALSDGPGGEGKAPKRNTKRPAASDARRSEAEIREERLQNDSVLLQFRIPSRASAEDAKQWRRIERLGFKVDRLLGCLLPFQLAQTGSGKTRTVLAAALALRIFRGQHPDLTMRGKKTALGWDLTPQASHLCHFGPCCNPFHLHYESAWRNWKRNYCGADGKCDCGQQPQCLRAHYASDVVPPLQYVKYSDTDKASVVARILPGLSVKVLAADAFAAQDQKRANRNKRLRATRKHDAQTNANIKKAAAAEAAAAASRPREVGWEISRKISGTSKLRRLNAAADAAAAAAAAPADDSSSAMVDDDSGGGGGGGGGGDEGSRSDPVFVDDEDEDDDGRENADMNADDDE